MNTTVYRPLIVTVVHGTWARGVWRRPRFRPDAPRWFERGGRFYLELEAALRAAGFDPTLRSYCWSGDNSLGARNDAGRELAELIRGTIVERPEVLQVLVGHSHGGTVAVRAAGELGLLTSALFVVTIATPFLDVREQRVSRAYKIGFWLLLMLSFGVPVGEFAKAGLAEWIDKPLARFYGNVAAVWLCYLGVKLLLYSTRWKRLVDMTCKHFDVHCPILVLRAPWDEAAIAIKIGNAAEAVCTFLRRFCTFLVLAISLPFLGVGVYSIFGGMMAAFSVLMKFLLWVVLLESWRSKLVIAAMSLLGAVALKAVNGSELAGCIASVSARVGAKPLGADRVEVATLPKVGKLAHSLYENPLTAPRIASWLASALMHTSDADGAPERSCHEDFQ